MSKTNKHRYKTELCNDTMTFQDCELAILRNAVDETEKIQSQKTANSEEIKQMIVILENFLRRKQCICYGGTAINNILPKHAQFYNRDIEIPDYDFYSKTPVDDAKELADIYYKAGYKDIEAKAGVHHGTYKVFVNFIPIADITELHAEFFKEMSKEAIKVNGIRYASPNFLRMNMFLELSRPAGDVSRWEKVLKRMTLLNKFYPILPKLECSTVEFQRKISLSSTDITNKHLSKNIDDVFERREHGKKPEESDNIYYIVRNTLIDQDVIFFGGYAASLYSRYMPKEQQRLLQAIPDFDVLSEDADTCANIVIEQLENAGYKKPKKVYHDAIGELIPEHIEICLGKETLVFIYRPIACHSYNQIHVGNNEIKIATIDTMLSLYFAFYYTNQPYYNKNRILCMTKFLFDVEQQNRLSQRGLLKRFSIDCYGKQETLEAIRSQKMEKFKELKDNRNSKEYEEWFMKYNPVVNGEMSLKRNTKQTESSNISERSETPDHDKKRDIKPRIKTIKTTKRIKRRTRGTRRKNNTTQLLDMFLPKVL